MELKVSIISLVFLHLIIGCDGQEEKIDDRPNIIFIYTDDQALWTLGVSGNDQAYTPNMDKLAKEGAYFTNAFVTTPVCSPARASIMTSQYASEYDILDFIPQPGHKLYNPDRFGGLDPESITFPEVLKDAGYTTGLVGKWHLGDWTVSEDKRFHPANNGFHYFFGITGGGASPKDPYLEKEGKVQQFEGLTTDILTDHAIEFIDKNKDAPFLLCLNYRAPHGAWLPVADKDWAPYGNLDPALPDPDYPDLDIEKAKRRMKEYLASTSGVDRNMGRLFAFLEKADIEENTIIIFTSDHGYNMGHNGIEHKGNGIWITQSDHPATKNIAENSRPNMYDNSLQVPAIVKWPGVVDPGKVIHETMISLDWYPTVIEMAGTWLPEGKIVRGRSLMPLLKGEAVEDWNNDLYAEYNMINYSQAYMRCYRTPEWKLVRDFLDPERDELYDLKADPAEHHNLIGNRSKRVHAAMKKLDAEIKEHMEEIDDPLLKGELPGKIGQ